MVSGEDFPQQTNPLTMAAPVKTREIHSGNRADFGRFPPFFAVI